MFHDFVNKYRLTLDGGGRFVLSRIKEVVEESADEQGAMDLFFLLIGEGDLTLYMLLSVCIFSILFSIYFLWC